MLKESDCAKSGWPLQRAMIRTAVKNRLYKVFIMNLALRIRK